MASRKELEALITLAGKIDPSLQKALRQTQKGIDGVGSKSGLMGKTVNKAFSVATKAIVVGTGAAVAGIGYLAKEGLQLASDLTEVQNVVDVTFNKNSPINAWSTTALKQFGLSELSAKKYSSTLGAMMKSSGIAGDSLVMMSKNLTGLSGDFSSFYNVAQDDAFNDMKSAMAGQTEPMLKYGINMQVANMEAYALAKGIKVAYKDMDQASKTALRYSYIMDKSKDAQGDFLRTQGTFANQTRLLKTNIQQLSAKVMGAAIPSLTKIAQAGNDFISKVDVNKIMDLGKKGFKSLGASINWVKNNMDWLAPVATGLVTTFIAFSVLMKLKRWLGGVTLATKLFTLANNLLNKSLIANPIFWVALAIGALVAIFIVAYKHNEKFRIAVNNLLSKLKELAINVFNSIVPALKAMYTWIKVNILPVFQQLFSYFMSNILPVLQKVASTVVDLAVLAFSTLFKVLTALWNNVLVPLFNFFTSAVLPILQVVGNIVLWLWQNVLAPLASFIIFVFKGAFEVAIPFIGNVFSTVFGAIGGIINAATSIFSGLITFITGVFTGSWSQAWQGVKDILTGIWGGIGAILKAPINFAIDALNACINGINKIGSVDLPIVGKVGISIPNIPKFAKGGIASQPSIFGEAGAEMAIPLRRTPRSLDLLNKTASLLGAQSYTNANPIVKYNKPRSLTKGSATSLGNVPSVIIQYSPSYSGTDADKMDSIFKQQAQELKQIVEDLLIEIAYEKERVSFG